MKQLVELHGGAITAESAGAGLGSTFRVRLPIIAAGTEPAAAGPRQRRREREGREPAVAQSDDVTLNGLTVLVVDDEADSRVLIQRLLEDRQACVLTAASAEEAIQSLSMRVPDALISDIGMPGEDGYALIRRIRRMDSPVAQVPAIALTAYARAEDRVRAIQAGYQLHLPKPVDPMELIKMIDGVARLPVAADARAPR